jgi:endonuclease/exonuclease/phosphatase family metal-dependent hydrolase
MIGPGRLAHGADHVLENPLESQLGALAGFEDRRALRRSTLFRELQPELTRLTTAFDYRTGVARPRRRGHLRAVAWNLERGKGFAAIRGLLETDPVLREADLLLLTELDVGMARSGNRHVARELAEALEMDHVFANHYVVLSPGDRSERAHPWPTGASLHGSALLSRFPITHASAVPLPDLRNKYDATERRLGGKSALHVVVEAPDGPLPIVVLHLDPFAPPRFRAHQMRTVLDALGPTGRCLIGGDLNTNTDDVSGPLGLVLTFARKLAFGVQPTIREYLTPDRVFERGLFDSLGAHGFDVDACNDRARATYYYDIGDEAVMTNIRDQLPRPVMAWMERQLAPWSYCVPLKIDWFATRGLRAHPGELPGTSAAFTLDRPSFDGERASDHNPIVCDLALGRPI